MKNLPRVLLAALLALGICVSVLPVLAETAEDTDTLVCDHFPTQKSLPENRKYP